MSQVSTNPKDKIGRTKPPMHLIPPAAKIQEAVVFGLGAKKYGPYNWRDHSVATSVYVGAAQRHLDSFWDGENVDPESGASHLAHARACLGIVLDAMSIGKLVDDRPPAGRASSLIKEFTQVTPPIVDLREKDGSYTTVKSDQDQSGLGVGISAGSGNIEAHNYAPEDENSGRPAATTIGARDQIEKWLVEHGCSAKVAKQIGGGITFTSHDPENAPFVYIAGPMRGYEKFNFPAFDAARDEALNRGFNVISPADIDRAADFNEKDTPVTATLDQRVFVFRDFYAIFFISMNENTANGVVYLEGWEKSTGAVGEFGLARWLGLKAYNPAGSPLYNVHLPTLGGKITDYLYSHKEQA